MRPNLNLMKATLTGALGGLLFGFDTVVISGAIDALVRLYHLNPQGKGWTVAIALIGTVVGSAGRGACGAEAGRAGDAAHHCGAICNFRASGCGLAWGWPVLHALPLHRRTGHWRFIGSGAGLHCRTGSGQVARAAGGRLSIQCCLRHSGGLHLELLHPHAASGCGGVALAGGHGRAARCRLSGAVVRHSPQPALAGLEEPRRGSSASAAN